MTADPKDKNSRKQPSRGSVAPGKRTEGATALHEVNSRSILVQPRPDAKRSSAAAKEGRRERALALVTTAKSSFYMDAPNRQFGAWRLDDEAEASPVKFSIFFPDRKKDPQQYEDRPDLAAGHYGDPRISSIHVFGDFQPKLGQEDWTIDPANALTPVAHEKGLVWTQTTKILPSGFYQYKYFVTFENGETRKVSDPCSRYGGRPPVESWDTGLANRTVASQLDCQIQLG